MNIVEFLAHLSAKPVGNILKGLGMINQTVTGAEFHFNSADLYPHHP